jgi:hypothetical protein
LPRSAQTTNDFNCEAFWSGSAAAKTVRRVYVGGKFATQSDESRREMPKRKIPDVSVSSSTARQCSEKFQKRCIDLVRPLLLSPMAAAGQHLDATQSGNEILQVSKQLVSARK